MVMVAESTNVENSLQNGSSRRTGVWSSACSDGDDLDLKLGAGFACHPVAAHHGIGRIILLE
ncbi:MAG: hypothetical protein ACFCVK_16085 [Acidimicrobiales bacterium]